jgi:hypothetical protein
MDTLSVKYREQITGLVKKSRGGMKVDEHNVYQPANRELLPFVDGIISENLLPGSEIRNFDNLVKLLNLAKSGKACILLLEHYSNFDLPAFIYMLRKLGPEGESVADAVTAIAGIKLSETNPIVTAFAEPYTRIVIYPSRSLEIIQDNLKDPKEMLSELMKGANINRAALKALSVRKKSGDLILVFPSGTRYRPWDPSTKKGVREIDSYLKGFEFMCLLSINGNILRLNMDPDGQMQEDLIVPDRLVYTVSDIMDCSEFRENVKKSHHHFGEDKKQAIVDALMQRLEEMHEETARLSPAS